MRRPLLGVSCCLRPGEEPVHGVIDRYVRAAARHTGADVLLLPALADLIDAESLCDRLDGLLLTGSPTNVEGARYGCAQASGPHDPARDASNFMLITAAVAAGKPILGICRGHQEINVAFGGSLREVGKAQGQLAHHADPHVPIADMFAHQHEVSLTPDGALARALGREHLTVNSVHFQAIDRLGDGLTIEARSSDGVIEAISARDEKAWLLGVQWHPEWETERDPASLALFALFGDRLREQVHK